MSCLRMARLWACVLVCVWALWRVSPMLHKTPHRLSLSTRTLALTPARATSLSPLQILGSSICATLRIARRQYAQSCGGEALCCDGYSCDGGRCVPGQFCLPEGNACDAEVGGCCGGLRCEGGVCTQPPALCETSGEPCQGDEPCCGALTCVEGACKGCLEDRLICQADEDCCSGFCRGGRCAPRPNPNSCRPLYRSC